MSEAIKAYVILKPGARASGDTLIAWCRARISAFKVPEIVEFRDAFPRTSGRDDPEASSFVRGLAP